MKRSHSVSHPQKGCPLNFYKLSPLSFLQKRHPFYSHQAVIGKDGQPVGLCCQALPPSLSMCSSNRPAIERPEKTAGCSYPARWTWIVPISSFAKPNSEDGYTALDSLQGNTTLPGRRNGWVGMALILIYHGHVLAFRLCRYHAFYQTSYSNRLTDGCRRFLMGCHFRSYTC